MLCEPRIYEVDKIFCAFHFRTGVRSERIYLNMDLRRTKDRGATQAPERGGFQSGAMQIA